VTALAVAVAHDHPDTTGDVRIHAAPSAAPSRWTRRRALADRIGTRARLPFRNARDSRAEYVRRNRLAPGAGVPAAPL